MTASIATPTQLWLQRVCIALGVVLMLAVAVLSLIGGVDVKTPTLGWDKANHALAYATIAFWWCGVVPHRRWGVLALAVVYGVLLEALQGLIPLRQPDALDALANSLGALAGLAIAAVLLRNGWVGAGAALQRRLAV